MPINAFDHVNIRTTQLATMVAFYESVLGLRPGERPPFSFAGAWLYCGNDAVVHLVEVPQPAKGLEPRIEHFAFRGSDLQAFLKLLKGKGVGCRIGVIPGWNTIQVNFQDPDGNRIHVDFDPSEGDALHGDDPFGAI